MLQPIRAIYPFLFLCLLAATSCNQEYTPKPKAYHKIDFPERGYKQFSPVSCPFTFEVPAYADVVADSLQFGEKNNNPCWYTINITPFNGTINLTYKNIDSKESFEKLVEDAHKLSYKHTRKADYINEVLIKNPGGVGGILYDVGGDAASNVQFFLTDSNKHFMRGALYFNNTPNTDSMAPVISFVKEDLKQLLKTFRWK